MKVVSSHLTLSKWLDKCIHIMSNHFFTGSGEPNYKKNIFSVPPVSSHTVLILFAQVFRYSLD